MSLTGTDIDQMPCQCRSCRDDWYDANPDAGLQSAFIICDTCGNKRCPHATDHNNTCTGSNDPGQEGSDYA
jgi:hypothetical protein